ncbi:putative hydrolase of the HAD superfamily [Paenibacillus catalpae]|uniref:Putative hydrolase of the HAD superfamily n=1 Tax=Paenibacillus catalpae TaxID=1045775 RepID=A0A1I1U3K2_9BACL|nr:HAD-IA family hydrolase [Paenibacillus catalpae]SFD65392.1 putative hydrolase of the HAD superfamily [Paenibacillus catalpae]
MRNQAVFFDLFETLITEFKNGIRKAPRSNHFVAQLGIDSTLFEREWRSRQEHRMNGTFPDFPSVLKDILNTLGHEVSEETIDNIHDERIASKTIPFNGIDPSILDMLGQLRSAGMKIGLVSNCTPEEVKAWEISALAPYFDDVIFSYAVNTAKPEPLIYQLACKRLGVSPSESVFVGDGGSNELSGASSFGMTAYHAAWFLPEDRASKITGYKKLRQPSELVDLIRD